MMTYEELAEEYVEGHSPSFKEFPKAPREDLKEAFLAGLKAGKPKWHKVADGDLPPVQKGHRYSDDIFTDEGDIAYYDPTFNTWWYAYEQPGLDSLEIEPPPVAWFELPKYTEE